MISFEAYTANTGYTHYVINALFAHLVLYMLYKC